MLFEPTLQVSRLVIERGDHVAYDEKFHRGVNVVRGENSSGKSTVLNALFYGLGGDLAKWSDAALLCTRVNVEVLLNGKVATLSREITPQPGQPMDVFGGGLEDSRLAPRSEWLRYPYRRSQSRESFSQALFRLLDIPEAISEESGNITIHQLLRLLYSDQLSPIEEPFRHEPFDSSGIRQSVGRLLCGAFDEELYANELRIRELTKDFEAKSAELRSLIAVVGRAGHSLTVEWLQAERAKLEKEMAETLTRIESAQRDAAASSAQPTLEAQTTAYDRLRDTQEQLSKARESKDRLELEIADSAVFIGSLEQKSAALSDANLIASAFGDVRFSHCPSCHAPVTEPDSEETCHLCKEPFDRERAQKRLVAIINDISIQLRQSRLLQEERGRELRLAEAELQEVMRRWDRQSAEYAQVRRSPADPVQVRLNALQRQLGYYERAIEDLNSRGKLVEEVDRLAREKDQINAALGVLKSRNDLLRVNQAERLSFAYAAISEEARWFVRHDLRREDKFEEAKSVDFDFAKNRMTVDGQEYFSASSRVILKNSFLSAFLFASLEHTFFRHPRFLLIDTIEDKGMEPVRSHNFQNLILERSQNASTDHQIIFATAMISPDLDTEDLTVGHFATRDNPTLAIG